MASIFSSFHVNQYILQLRGLSRKNSCSDRNNFYDINKKVFNKSARYVVTSEPRDSWLSSCAYFHDFYRNLVKY